MSKYLTPGLVGGVIAAGVLVALTVMLWPPGPVIGSLLGVLGLLLAIAIGAHVSARRQYRELWEGQLEDMSPEQLAEWRMRALFEKERQLELRELKLGRQMRVQQIGDDAYIDILDTDPPAHELGRLVEIDRELITLIESESQRAFERIKNNRYGTGDGGVDTVLISTDIRDFVETVARLYRPDAKDALLETDIERIAKSMSSAALHMLVVVDDLPINLQSYSTAKMYRLIRRGVSYYGTYKAFQPYVEQGLNILQLARFALGANPVAVGAAWAAGKLATHGAKVVGERFLQRRALQLLTDFIRVIGYEAAMMYGGDFRHRDANWLLGAELVNLEIARLPDRSGRDAALSMLCNLALRHEFDRLRFVNHLASSNPIDTSVIDPQVTMTEGERHDAATVLAKHARDTDADFAVEKVAQWRESVELLLRVDLGEGASPGSKSTRSFRPHSGIVKLVRKVLPRAQN